MRITITFCRNRYAECTATTALFDSREHTMKFYLLVILFPISAIVAQSDDSWKIYDDTHLARIDITIDTTALNWIYNNVQSDSEHYAAFHFKNKWIDEAVDSIGFRLRGNTSRVSQKKSFKVSFNSFMKGRKFHGVTKLNLNGEHNDPSIIRSKLSFDLFHDIGIAASRAHHVRVYINKKYYGLYISVESMDGQFLKKNYADDTGNLWKCLYPADLTYLGADPNLYKAVMNSPTTPAYELSTNEETGDFMAFAKLVDVINNTPAAAFPDSIEKYLYVNHILEYFAVNTLVGSWDDYRSLMNNYYLYHVQSENKFTIIPYDYDNTFGVDWSGENWSTANPYNPPTVVAGARPLSDKLLANNQFRDIFTHFVGFYRDSVYRLPLWEDRINRIKDSISGAAYEDTYRTLDYGFTTNDFDDSYSASAYQNKHVKTGVKQFVNARNASIVNQLNYRNAAPLAYAFDYSPKHPSAEEPVVITASCFAHAGLKEVTIQFTLSDTSALHMVPMKYVPVVNTKHVEEADRWVGAIPPLGAGMSGHFKIVLKDSLDQTQSTPRSGFVNIQSSSSSSSSVIINEFMADNISIPDSAGEFDDWLELFNPTPETIQLTNKYLSDNPKNLAKWKFTQPNLMLAPNQFVIVWCDEDSAQKGIHTNFKLSAGGEFLTLTDSDGVTVLDSLSFGVQKANISYGRYPNASNSWYFMPPTPGFLNSAVDNVKDGTVAPARFSLSVFPNLFNPSTTIYYTLTETNEVWLKIFDVLGKEVATLVSGRLNPGSYSVQWDGVNLSSGIYFCHLQAGSYRLVKKMMLLK